MKRKNHWKKMLAFLLAAALLAACSGGGGGDEGSSSGRSSSRSGRGNSSSGGRQTVQIDKDKIFRMEQITLTGSDFSLEDTGRVAFIDGEILGAASHYHEGEVIDEETGETDGYQEYYMVRFSPDGGNVTTVMLDEHMESDTYYGSECFDKEGSLYAIRTKYTPGDYTDDVIIMNDLMSSQMTITQEDDSMPAEALPEPAEEEGGAEEASDTEENAPNEPADGREEEPVVITDEETYTLVKFDREGNLVFETELKRPEGFTDYFGIQTMVVTGDDSLLLSGSFGIAHYSATDGSFIKNVYESENWPDMMVTGAGDVYLMEYENGNQVLKLFDTEKGAFGAGEALSNAMWNYDLYNMKPALGADFLLTDNIGIYTWNIGDDVPQQILNFVDSDLDLESVSNMVQISETEIIAFYWQQTDDETGSTYRCSKLIKVPPEEVKDRVVLTLGVNWIDSEVRRAVVQYNQNSRDVRISIVDYSKYITDDDWQAGYNQLNQDIISGNAPDMMILDNSVQIESYEAKGILEPLDSYFENDPEIHLNDYMTNVFDAYRYKGKLYMIIPTFSARSYVMKKEYADKIDKWDYETLQSMVEGMGIKYDALFGWPMTSETFVQMAMILDYTTYVDWSAQEAKFDSRQFIDLLNFAKNFPDESEIPDDWWENNDYDTAFREGRALLGQAYYDSFEEYAQMKYGTFGSEIAFVGFPREDGTGGSTVMAGMQLAMNADAYDKDACWEFMRYFLTKEYQSRFITEYRLPVLRSALEEKAERAMEQPYWTDEDGEKHYYENTYYMAGEEITIPPLSRAEVDQCMELFESLDASYSYNEMMMQIVMEEVAPFFRGQKTAEEVARIIQSKMQVYIDENS